MSAMTNSTVNAKRSNNQNDAMMRLHFNSNNPVNMGKKLVDRNASGSESPSLTPNKVKVKSWG
jgi:hypothetical protein